MRLVTMTDPGRIEVAWMWLPFWISINPNVKKDLDEALTPFMGREVDDTMLDEAHGAILEVLTKQFPIPGLGVFLQGICHVSP